MGMDCLKARWGGAKTLSTAALLSVLTGASAGVMSFAPTEAALLEDPRIFSIGDSITYGFRSFGSGEDDTESVLASEGSYRRGLYGILTDQGYSDTQFYGSYNDAYSLVAGVNYWDTVSGGVNNSANASVSDPWSFHYGLPGIHVSAPFNIGASRQQGYFSNADLANSGGGAGAIYQDGSTSVRNLQTNSPTGEGGDLVQQSSLVHRLINDPVLGDNGGVTASGAVRQDLDNSVLGADLSALDSPNVVIIHAGTNDIGTTGTTAGNDPTLSVQIDDLERLVRAVDQVANTTNASSGTTFFDADYQIVLAKILPNTGGTTVEEEKLNRTINYNLGIDAFVDDLRNSADADEQDLGNRITVIDLYEIELTAGLLGYIAGLDATDYGFTAGTDLLSLIDTDGDNFVDWVNGLDESSDAELLSAAGLSVNAELLADGVHPTRLGYDIFAYVAAEGVNPGGVIPEPGTAVLAATGLMLTVVRRRRRSS